MDALDTNPAIINSLQPKDELSFTEHKYVNENAERLKKK